jgi:hypothetical protein
MLTVKTTELDLIQTTNENLGHRVNVQFPINKYAGAAESGVVYFEIAPGDRLATHTDSQEEILYIVAGECEAHAGGRPRRDPRDGPARRDEGDRRRDAQGGRLLRRFHDRQQFDEPLQPVGERILEQAPVPP